MVESVAMDQAARDAADATAGVPPVRAAPVQALSFRRVPSTIRKTPRAICTWA